MKKIALLFLMLMIPLLGAGCGGGSGGPAEISIIAENGTVQLTFEEGYLIQGHSGRSYKPTNLSAGFQQRNLRVRFRGRNKGSFDSQFGKVATLVEIVEIQRL